MNHPLTTYPTKKYSPIWGYAFFSLCILAILRKSFSESEPLKLSNPISMNSIEKRYWDIMSDFRAIKSPSEFIDNVISSFNLWYTYGNEANAALKYQDKFMPYFELSIAKLMVRRIYEHESLHKAYHDSDVNGESSGVVVFPNTRSGQWLKKYLTRRMGTDFGGRRLWSRILDRLASSSDEFAHYLQMISRPDMEQARTIDFNKGTLRSLFDRLKRVTDEVANKTRRLKEAKLLGEQSPTEDFLDAGNGWKWVKILDSYNQNRDETEAILMGHCATPEWPNSYLISLRDPNKSAPWVTATIKELVPGEMFIIGQVKGRGDIKPDKKFEPQILKLFLDSRIIKQSSDDPRDWRLPDFSAGNKDFLLAQKPYLKDVKELANYFPIKKLTKLIAQYDEKIDVLESGEVRLPSGTLRNILVDGFSRYDRNKQKRVKEWWLEALEDQHIDIDYNIPNYEAADWFKDEFFDTKDGQIIYKAVAEEMKNAGQEFEDIDDVVNNLKFAFHYGSDLSQELYNAIADSVRYSNESSLLSELEGKLQGYLERLSDELPKGFRLAFYQDGEEIDIGNVYYQSSPGIYIVTDAISLLSQIDDFGETYSDGLTDLLDRLFADAVENTKTYWHRLELIDYSSEYALDNFKEHFLFDLLEKAKSILRKK